MAKWTEENDMLQACAQLIQVHCIIIAYLGGRSANLLIQDQSNTTYSQCEKLIATGPRPPPYLKGDMYRPGIQARKLGAQALDIMKMKRRSLTLSGLAHGSSRMDGDKIDELQDGTGPVHTFTPADVVILATFAMFILLAIAKVCWVVGYSRHRSRGASFTVTTRQVFTAIFRDCLIFHRGTNGNMMEHCIAIKSRHVGSVGVLRNIRRRLHHHRQDDIIHELLGSDRVLLDQYPHVPIEPQTDSIAVTSGLST